MAYNRTSTFQGRDMMDRDDVERRSTVVRDRNATADSRVVASRTVWYIAGFIIVLLAFRVVLFLLGANPGSPFVDFIYAVSAPFAAPFTGIFPTPAAGAFALDTASIVAILVYAIAAWGISKLLTLNRPSGTADV